MQDIWTTRLRGIATGLAVASFAAAGLGGVLLAAGDALGAQAVAGFAAVLGLAFITDLILLVLRLSRGPGASPNRRP